MIRWSPTGHEWEGQDAYIIGGGESLSGFDFTSIQGKHVIGCNDAIRLGPSICEICVFGDNDWYLRSKFDLQEFGNRIVCVATGLRVQAPWITLFDRVTNGWGEGTKLGWYFNVGTTAVNLAVNMGAKRIFLLGFDMQPGIRGRTHWHHHHPKPTTTKAFSRHSRGFSKLAEDLKGEPVEVFNVSNGTTALQCFPIITLDQMKEMTCRLSL